MKNKTKQSGQVLMVVLLIVLVATLAGLTLFARSLSESSAVISQEEKDKTFNKAEEQASKYLAYPMPTSGDGVEVTSGIGSEGVEFILNKNAIIGIEISSSATVSWTDCRAILAEIWNGSDLVAYRIYKPNSSSTCNFDNTLIIAPEQGTNDIVYQDVAEIDGGINYITLTDSSVRIKALTGNMTVMLSGGISDFWQIASEQSGDTDAEISQRIEQDRSGNFLPEIFDYVLYSGESIIKTE